MHILPLQTVLVLRLALIGLMTEGEDAQTVQVLRNIQDTTDHRIGTRTVTQSAAPHLCPARAQAQILSLVLHGDGGNTRILHPAVVLHRIAQYHNSQRSALDELSTQVLGIRQFLDIHLILYHDELPATLSL